MQTRSFRGLAALLVIAACAIAVAPPTTASAEPVAPAPAAAVVPTLTMPIEPTVVIKSGRTAPAESVGVCQRGGGDSASLTIGRHVTADAHRACIAASSKHMGKLLMLAPFLVGMTALAADRDTLKKDRSPWSYPVGAAKKIYGGSIVVAASTGYAQGATTAATHRALGRAIKTVDNSNGAAGDLRVDVERGVFLFGNSASGDLITVADIGKTCYLVDDQTLAKTDNSGARSAGGTVMGVEAAGVWVAIPN